ncbi:uncharacterized protein LOC134539672 [Bacillus rossius redtenbacheri]|uniref:uncharacterized protein LOC134539672 n=1 Tax=Bacillus rossius redtenbacheri TaxID=93214 RepID=UPI002FDCA7E7
MGPYPRTPRGNRFLLVVTDLFTRWTEAYPCRNVRAATITKILAQEFLPRWGYPQSALSDNGSQFLGRQWRTWCDDHQIQHHTTPAYHPRANPTERRNQELKAQMRIRLSSDHAQWDKHISDALFCMRRRTTTWEQSGVSGLLMQPLGAHSGMTCEQSASPTSCCHPKRLQLEPAANARGATMLRGAL